MSFSSNKVKPNNIDIDSSQTLENKVLDASNDFSGDIIDPSRSDVKQGLQSELETYASSATNGQLCFATDTKLMYQVLDSALVSVGSGSAAINYIVNPDLNIDVSDITGDTNLVISQETVAPLRDAGSLKIAKGAIDASTQSVLIDMNPVDIADLAKKLTISFDIDASNVNYKDGDAQVRIIKDPAGTPETIRVNGEDIKGGKNTHIAQFQTDHTEVDYALEIYWADTGVLATELILDNIQVGPREVVKGAAMTDWKAYTPTLGAFGNGTSDLAYKRVGDHIEIKGTLTIGSTLPTGTITWSLPSGLSADYTTMQAGVTNTDAYQKVGYAQSYSPVHTGNVIRNVTSNTTFYVFGYDGNTTTWNASTPFVWTVGKTITLEMSVPIQGWSSNAVSSEDLGGREIVVRAFGTSVLPYTINTPVPFNTTIEEDTTASWDGSTFTAPEKGTYSVDGMIAASASVSGSIIFFINGSLKNYVEIQGALRYKAFSGLVHLEKGDLFTIRVDNNFTLENSFTAHQIHIQKLASPQTILETETVAARYTSNAEQSVPNSTSTTLVYEDITSDTHNAYNISTGVYTVPVSGWYDIKSSVRVQHNVSSGEQSQMILRVNGVLTKAQTMEFNGTNATCSRSASISDHYPLNKGDELIVQYFHSTGGADSIASGSDGNVFSIVRLK